MKYLYIIAYKDDEEKMQEEVIPADTVHHVWSVFNNIMQVKNIKHPTLVRMTEYEKLAVINYDGKTNRV